MRKKLDDFEKLRALLFKNTGYAGKFTDYLLNENIPYSELEKLYSELSFLKQKQSPIDINKLKYEGVVDAIQIAKDSLSINSLVVQFPSEQKKFARDFLVDDTDWRRSENRNILLKVSLKTGLSAFTNKVSRYKTKDELLSALKVFSKDPINDREKVIELLKSTKSEVTFNNEDILIVKIDNYEDICKLGSDTSWCIVRSNSTYDSYAKKRYQFILYDYTLDEYNPQFKIGFTVTDEFVLYAAHDILDGAAYNRISEVLKKYNISFRSILPKREPIIFDIKKLNSRTAVDKFSQICNECDIKLLPEIIRIILKTNKTEEKKKVILRKCYKRLFDDRDWVNVSELNKISGRISPSFYHYVHYYAKNILTKNVSSNIRESTFIKGLEVWENEDYNNMSVAFIRDIDDAYSKETLYRFSDKLNNIYSNDLVQWKGKGRERGFKLGKDFEGIMLVMNALLERVESTPNYSEIIKIPNHTIKYYNDILRLPIDLSDGDVDDDQIDLIIKKDYNESWLYIKNSLDKYTKIIEHLSDHKIFMRITKDSLRRFMIDDKYNLNNENDRLINILRQFNLNKLVCGKIISDGNVTIKLT